MDQEREHLRMSEFKVQVPPIKSQGIKTKLVVSIGALVPAGFEGRWIEPFMGTGVVGLNLARSDALMCDTNPHLINFYKAVKDGAITAEVTREYLQKEGEKLSRLGEEHYYTVRTRFNETCEPLDFLFLSRAGFNGMMRFNRKGGFNIPFCRKPDRFAQSYVTKITNQVAAVAEIIERGNFNFKLQDFENTISEARSGDIIYCDPPYMGRHVDYFNGWTDENERTLHRLLKDSPAEFILSTWAGNKYRTNLYLQELWADMNVLKQDHFYHVGANLENRSSMVEAIVYSSKLALSINFKAS
jgi:DNA adenine methylase